MTVDVREMPTENGQLVEVVLRGRVSSIVAPEAAEATESRFVVGSDTTANIIAADAEHVVSVEILPEPDVPWRVGDAVHYPADGTSLVRSAEWLCSTGYHCPLRPHTDEQVDVDVADGVAVVLVRGGVIQLDAETRDSVLDLLDLEHMTQPCPLNEIGPCRLAHQVARVLGVAP